MRFLFRKYFSFNTKERNGIIIFISLILFVLILKYNLTQLFQKKPIDFSKYNSEINSFLCDSLKEKETLSYLLVPSVKDKSISKTLFSFNPNTASEKQFKDLGVSPKIISTIKNYLSKGGKFRTKEDFKKIYGLKKSDYDILSPFIHITQDSLIYQKKESYQFSNSLKSKEININSIKFNQLIKIEGVDTILAWSILNYRKILGGFNNMDQLYEVKGIDTNLLRLISSRIYICTDSIKKINLNSYLIKDLNSHPYLTYNQSKSIFNYRVKHGDFITLSDLKKSVLIDDKTYLKLLPYLSLD